jgi:hypothetical protein
VRRLCVGKAHIVQVNMVSAVAKKVHSIYCSHKYIIPLYFDVKFFSNKEN